MIRELSSQIPDPPLAFPMYHMTKEEREVYDANYRLGEHKDEILKMETIDGILELLTEYPNESSLAEYYFAYLESERHQRNESCTRSSPALRN